MSETILVANVVAKDGNKPWKIQDGNGIEYVTWDDALGAKASALAGEQATITAEVTQKPSKSGQMFTNRLLKEIDKVTVPEPAVANASEFEPSINTAKQIVIIRQSSWAQANTIYGMAVDLYMKIMPEAGLDMQAVHAIAWQLISSNKRPDHSTIGDVARELELRIRDHYFPLDGEEIPF